VKCGALSLPPSLPPSPLPSLSLTHTNTPTHIPGKIWRTRVRVRSGERKAERVKSMQDDEKEERKGGRERRDGERKRERKREREGGRRKREGERDLSRCSSLLQLARRDEGSLTHARARAHARAVLACLSCGDVAVRKARPDCASPPCLVRTSLSIPLSALVPARPSCRYIIILYVCMYV
jgi:hypothetical protein